MLVPRFRHHLRVEVVGEETVLFATDQRCLVLNGRLFALLAPNVDGRSSAAEIAERLDGVLSPGSVRFGLFCLREAGLLVGTIESDSTRLEGVVDSLNLDIEGSGERLAESPVCLTALGKVCIDGFEAAMKSLGLCLGDAGGIKVVAVEDYLQKDLEQFNREALQSSRPWMLAKPNGASFWWGPLLVPGRTGCWHCLARRLRANLWSDHLSSLVGSSVIHRPTCRPDINSLSAAGMNLAALSLFRWVADPDFRDLEDRIYVLDGASRELTEHAVPRFQHCPECGRRDVHEKPLAGFRATLGAGNSELAKGCNTRDVVFEDTFERLEKYVSPITGIVGSINPVFEADEIPLYVYATGERFGMIERPDWLPESFPMFWCAGRGTSRLEAKTCVLCESVERYSGVFQGTETRRRATFGELGPTALHPNLLMLFSDRQMSNRRYAEGADSNLPWIPEPLEKGAKIEWTAVRSLTEDRERYLPTAFCYYGYPDPTATRFCKADSNGNAAGNSLEDAIVRGFLELVERDCAAIWWYNRIPRAGINLDSFDLPFFEKVHRYYRSRGREIAVLEISSDFEIPTCVALSRPENGDLSGLTLGFGASFNMSDAIRRALLEMTQLMPFVLDGGNTISLTGLPGGSEIDDCWLRPAEDVPAKTAADFSPSEASDLDQCLRVAEQHGLEVLLLDQTRDEVGLPVVKVLIPSLRPWWPRFAPGRLYDVPVRMGWIGEPVLEEELNPAWLSL